LVLLVEERHGYEKTNLLAANRAEMFAEKISEEAVVDSLEFMICFVDG
jgi:hypothetical protein